jgi:hypothetical protein
MTISFAAVGFACGFGVDGDVTLAGTIAIIFGLAGLISGAALAWGIIVDARSLRLRMTGSASRRARR